MNQPNRRSALSEHQMAKLSEWAGTMLEKLMADPQGAKFLMNAVAEYRDCPETLAQAAWRMGTVAGTAAARQGLIDLH